MRTLRGLTMAQLADRIVDNGGDAVSAATIGRWQRGQLKVPADVMMPICKSLECTVYSLYHSTRGSCPVDERMVDQFRELPEHEKEILQWIIMDWNGDMHILIQSAGMYAAMPQNVRQEVAYTCLRLYVQCQQQGKVIPGSPEIDSRKVYSGWQSISQG